MKKALIVAGIVIVLAVMSLALAVRIMLGGDRVKAAIEVQAAAALGQPVVVQMATPRLFPRPGLELGGVIVGARQSATIGRVRLSTGLRPLFRRRIEDAEVLVERGRIDVPWAIAAFAALTESAARPPGSFSTYPVTLGSIGAITLRQLDLVAGTRTVTVDFDSALTGDRLAVTRMTGRSEGSDFSASGEFSSLARRTGTFKVISSSLDLDTLLAFFAAATPEGGKQLASDAEGGKDPAAATPPFDVTVTIDAKRGRVLGAEFSDLATSSRMAGDDVRLDPLRVHLFGGRYDGTVTFFGSRGEPRFEWRGSVANLDAAQLAAFAGVSGSITGRLGGTLALATVGTDPQQAIHRTHGSARITITDGRIPGLEIVRAVILAFGKPSGERPGGSGEAFSRLAATLAVAAQTLTTEDLTFASRDFDLTARGRLALASQQLDFTADVLLSRELSAQAGRDLYRLARDDDRIVLPARITGTVSSPVVFIDIPSALQRALRNRAQDEVKSLFERFKRRIIKE
jgi:uncharacterized protein involved in outer membrane biogenesis